MITKIIVVISKEMQPIDEFDFACCSFVYTLVRLPHLGQTGATLEISAPQSIHLISAISPSPLLQLLQLF